jgi:hypothetical protein
MQIPLPSMSSNRHARRNNDGGPAESQSSRRDADEVAMRPLMGWTGRHRMIAARPPEPGDPRWDAFLAGLAEWLAVQAGMPAPGRVRNDNRYLRHGWWVTPMKSMRVWEYAGSPMSFQSRGVYLHRESLTNV